VDFTQDADFSELVSNELSQIRLSEFIVHLIFVEESWITVESSFEHLGCDCEILSRFDVCGITKEMTIHRIIGKRVIFEEIESGNRLRFVFEGGESIRIIRGDERFESCSIHVNGKLYVV
jgi:hypothetical protein